MGCDHDCSSCGSACSSREPQSMLEPLNEKSSVKKVIAVVSGKGGVGKSLVTSLLATLSARAGRSTAILDADITGPSIPKSFGIKEQAMGCEDGILPAETESGIKMMSINLMVEDETSPVVWRGPVIAGAVKQFWSEVVWGDIDLMFIDCPPGTGDVPLTVFQSIPVDGIIVVTSPQELVSMIVGKAVKMAQMMNIPVLGIVENMSYFVCPNCQEKHYIYGESHIEEIAAQYGIENIARMPVNPEFAAAVDRGEVESFDGEWLDELLGKLLY